MQTTTYLIFKAELQNLLIKDGLFNPKWFDSNLDKVSLYWNAGETIDSAYDSIKAFAEAQLSKNVIRGVSPTNPVICTKITRNY